MDPQALLRRRVPLAPASTAPLTVGVMRLWKQQMRLEVSISRDFGFSRYMTRFRKRDLADSPDLVFSPAQTRGHPVPVGDVFDRDEWDAPSQWTDDCIPVFSYDHSVSQHERAFLLHDLQVFLTAGLAAPGRGKNSQRRYTSVRSAMFTTQGCTPPRSTCKWPFGFLVIVLEGVVLTTEDVNFPAAWEEVCRSSMDPWFDIVMQFPWSSCSDTPAECKYTPACMCMHSMSRSVHRPTLVFDRRIRRDCLVNRNHPNDTDEEDQTLWVLEHAISRATNTHVHNYYPPTYSLLTRWVRERILAIESVLKAKLGIGDDEITWVLLEIVARGGLVVEETLHTRVPPLL